MATCFVIIPDNGTANAMAVCLRSLAGQLDKHGYAPLKRVRIDRVQRMLVVEVEDDDTGGDV